MPVAPAPCFLSHPCFWHVLPFSGFSEVVRGVGMLDAPQPPVLGSVWGRRRGAGLGREHRCCRSRLEPRSPSSLK